MWDRLSERARAVMRLALAESEQQGHGYVGDPYGSQLGRRGRKHLSQLGWTIGPVNPASALLQAHDIDTIRLRSQLDRMS